MPTSRRSGLLFLALAAFALACSESTPPVILLPASMQMAPADTTVAQGQSFQLRTVVFDTAGDPIPLRPEYASSDPAVATVSSTGLVQTGAAGSAAITATLGVLVRQTQVQVSDSLVGERVPVTGGPYSAAIASTGVAYVTQPTLNRLVRFVLPSQTPGNTVPTGQTPTEVTFNSTGSRAYVTDQYSSTVTVVDVATDTPVDTIAVGNRPFEVIVAPGDSILYVAKIDSVYGVRLSTEEIIVRFAIPDVGNGVAIAHDTLLYVSTHNGGTVVEFNLRTRAVGRTFAVGGVPQKLAVSPDGNVLYIANESGYVQFWNLVGGGQIGMNLTLPSAAYGMARRPSNGLLYVTSGPFGVGNIYIIDPTSRTLTRTIAVGGSPRRVVFNSSGSIGLVPNENGWVDFLK